MLANLGPPVKMAIKTERARIVEVIQCYYVRHLSLMLKRLGNITPSFVLMNSMKL